MTYPNTSHGSVPPLRCRDAVDQLWRYLDGETTPEDTAALEAHLSFCLRCCGELDFARELRQTLRSTGGTTMPADVTERLTAAIDAFETTPTTNEERS